MELSKSNQQGTHYHPPRHTISEELKTAIQHLIERLRQNQPIHEPSDYEQKKIKAHT